MKKLIKPASLLFNLLVLLTFFILGLLFAGWINAGEGQGLAAGAIVLGYGVLFAFTAFFASFFATYHLDNKLLVKLNMFLTLLLTIAVAIITYNYNQRKKKQEKENESFERPVTAPANRNQLLAYADGLDLVQSNSNPMGLGFFKPNFHDNPVIHFYSNPNLEKSINEHHPIGLIRFSKTEIGDYTITAAPPWLVPAHLKLDYGILYFRVLSLTQDFVEVVGNEHTQQSFFMDRYEGQIQYWPDFLLGVNSVELLNKTPPEVKIKPLEHASRQTLPYSFLVPLRVKEEWIEVKLVDTNYVEKGIGWIRWKKENQLLISYSLLS